MNYFKPRFVSPTCCIQITQKRAWINLIALVLILLLAPLAQAQQGGGFNNRPPVAKFNYAPTTVLVNQNVTFSNQSSDLDGSGDIASYPWDFGDGVQFSYWRSGDYHGNPTLDFIFNRSEHKRTKNQ